MLQDVQVNLYPEFPEQKAVFSKKKNRLICKFELNLKGEVSSVLQLEHFRAVWKLRYFGG
jgi:hypothetical protein